MVIRSMSGCLPTKYRPSARRNRLMRSRTSLASFSRAGKDIEAMRSSGSSVTVVSSRGAAHQIAVNAAAEQVFVFVEPLACLVANREVIAGVPDHQRFHEVEDREAHVRVRVEAIGHD